MNAREVRRQFKNWAADLGITNRVSISGDGAFNGEKELARAAGQRQVRYILGEYLVIRSQRGGLHLHIWDKANVSPEEFEVLLGQSRASEPKMKGLRVVCPPDILATMRKVLGAWATTSTRIINVEELRKAKKWAGV